MKVKATVKSDMSRLSRMTQNARATVENVLDVAAHNVEAGWKERITEVGAVDTGAYRASVHVAPDHKQGERVIADSVEYGIYVEMGTSRMAARPCAAPALEAEKAPLKAALKAVTK